MSQAEPEGGRLRLPQAQKEGIAAKATHSAQWTTPHSWNCVQAGRWAGAACGPSLGSAGVPGSSAAWGPAPHSSLALCSAAGRGHPLTGSTPSRHPPPPAQSTARPFPSAPLWGTTTIGEGASAAGAGLAPCGHSGWLGDELGVSSPQAHSPRGAVSSLSAGQALPPFPTAGRPGLDLTGRKWLCSP